MLGIFSVIYYSVVCLVTSFLVVRFGFPVRLLRHLQVYVLTDQNAGVPMSAASNGSGRSKGRKKNNEPEFDESSGKMMRILVQEGHLYSRKFFREFDETILFACIGIMAVFSREILTVIEMYVEGSGFFTNQQNQQQQQSGDQSTPKQNLSSSSTGLFLMDHGGMIPLLLAAVALWKIVRNWASVEWDRSTTRSADFTQCLLAGIASCLITGFILFALPPSLTGFDFDSVAQKAGVTITNHFKSKGLAKENIPEFIIPPTFIKTSLVLFSGVIGALSLPAAIRFVRCFYLSTSQQPWDTGIIHQGFWSALLWNVSFVLPVLAAALWIRPLTEVFEPVVAFRGVGSGAVTGGGGAGAVPAGSLGAASAANATTAAAVGVCTLPHLGSYFGSLFGASVTGPCSGLPIAWFQVAAILLSGISRLLLLRIAVQSHLNTALVYWYDQLHSGKEWAYHWINARVQLTYYFICKVAIQSAALPIVTLLLVGIARSRGPELDPLFDKEGSLLPPLLVREVAMFLAWWCNAAWALQTCAILALFRVGQLKAV
ncbi:hypothetical protein CLOM_g6593 [Closterium sp. NIES-68]|nr:hypothetical protein CLOM_g9300 [Closterium sp. NIES-68]GJP47402.1 hypothetical protein CLOM_g6593 [Closterium sp. NIES-68]GJP69579.1 hypothetical protein CLOP_g578 [Closterium sp. NIES-67]